MSSADEILTGALGLSRSERARIAKQLLASLHAESDPEAADAWTSELRSRLEEVQNGSVELEDWEDVDARVRARLVQIRS